VIPLVSILIPAFNAEATIADTIQSAIRQTWPRKEIIVVDDGSHDQTLAAARRWATREVSLVAQAHQGAAAARNRAVSICQGDFIQWLDADDLLAADKIATQMALLDRGAGVRTLLSSAWGRFMLRPQRATFVPTPLWCDLSPIEWLLRKMWQDLYMQTATWLVSRELTEAAGPWNTQLLSDDDGEYFCRVLLASHGTRFSPEAKVFYRISGATGLSYIGRSQAKMKAQFVSMQLHIRHLRSLEDSERVRAACVRYLQTWLPTFYPESPEIVEQAAQLAATLGGRLEIPPQLSGGYAWIDKGFGRPLAKRLQMLLAQWKWSAKRSVDKVLAPFPIRTTSTTAGVLK